MDFEVRANRILMPAYALFVLLGYVQRKRPDRHKRFMLLASFFMLGPILARCFDPVLAPILPYFAEETVDTMFIVYFFSLWSACFLSLLVLDWMTLRRLHGISLAGTGVFCGTWTTAFLS